MAEKVKVKLKDAFWIAKNPREKKKRLMTVMNEHHVQTGE